MLALLAATALAAPALAAPDPAPDLDTAPGPVSTELPLPTWDETPEARVGIVLTRTGVYGILGGSATVLTGTVLMASDSCSGCFEPDAQFWTGLAFVSIGVIGVGTAVPLTIIGPVLVAHAHHHAGVGPTVALAPLPRGFAITGSF